MVKYIIYKFFIMIITLFVIITSVFFIMKALPGGPFDLEKEMPDFVKNELETKYSLNKPLAVQYVKYMKNIILLDLGESYKNTDEKVTHIIRDAFKYSALIGFLSILISIFTGLIFGVILAKNNYKLISFKLKKNKIGLIYNKAVNKVISFILSVGIAIPNFILAIFFVYIFCERVNMVPIGGIYSWKNYIGPTLVLSIYPASFIAKMVKVNMIKVLDQSYIGVLKSYGVSLKKILFKYSLREVLIPVITYIAPMIASVMMGSFAVEKMFAIPGLGKVFIDSVFNRDYYVVFGVILFYSLVYLIAIFITDICYLIVDPRLKLSFKFRGNP